MQFDGFDSEKKEIKRLKIEKKWKSLCDWDGFYCYSGQGSVASSIDRGFRFVDLKKLSFSAFSHTLLCTRSAC